MHFVDEVTMTVKAGDGGRGCVSFLREKFRPWGGPNGGNGGNGGDVILRVDPQRNTLLDLAHRHHARAARGEHGRGKDQHGKNSKAAVFLVPPGTIARDAKSGEILADLRTVGEEVVVAQGGKGGKGNAFFTSSTNRAPRFAQPGLIGETRLLQLELRLLADVGLVGFPNAGKSTLISAVSAARPRVADFPFTTLTPNLGVVRFADEGSFVMADVPGLIEGAHTGYGLGVRFLRHLSRTSILVHLIDISDPERNPYEDYRVINCELEAFDSALAMRPQLVVVTKADLTITRERFPEAENAFTQHEKKLHLISAATGEGKQELVKEIVRLLEQCRREAEAAQESKAPGP